MTQILGVDIGGSGIKGALVNPDTGVLLTERIRIETPEGAKPNPVAKGVLRIVEKLEWNGPIGCGFPAVVRHGVGYSAANIDKSWIGKDIEALFTRATGCPTTVINDADAAGLAEMRFGAGQGRGGVVMIITIGTGIGTAIFTEGVLLPNTELGHLQIRGKDAEKRASDAVRQQKNLSWEEWGKRLNEYFMTLEQLFWPDLVIVGGGICKEHEKFFPYLTIEAEIVPARFLNLAGIVGAALAAAPTAAHDPALRQTE